MKYHCVKCGQEFNVGSRIDPRVVTCTECGGRLRHGSSARRHPPATSHRRNRSRHKAPRGSGALRVLAAIYQIQGWLCAVAAVVLLVFVLAAVAKTMADSNGPLPPTFLVAVWVICVEAAIICFATAEAIFLFIGIAEDTSATEKQSRKSNELLTNVLAELELKT